MGFATHLGPWLLGTVKHTTGSTVGTLRNIGTTVVSQTKKLDIAGYTAAAHTDILFTIPAGSQILDIWIDVLTAVTTSASCALKLGDGSTTDLFWPATAIMTSNATTGLVSGAGRVARISNTTKLAGWCGAASAAAPDGVGVGVNDVKIVSTITPATDTAGAGLIQFTVFYTVRNADGTSVPTTYTGP